MFDSLLKLSTIKTNATGEDAGTMLNYIVRLVEKQRPDALDFGADMSDVYFASQQTFTQLDSDQRSLMARVEVVRNEYEALRAQPVQDMSTTTFLTVMSPFLSKALPACEQLKTDINATKEAVKHMMIKFAQPLVENDQALEVPVSLNQGFPMIRRPRPRTHITLPIPCSHPHYNPARSLVPYPNSLRTGATP